MSEHQCVAYIRKDYSASFLLGALEFSLSSEDRGNGEYKHFVWLKFLGKQILYLCFRTGKTKEGTNMSIGDFRSGRTNIEFDEIPIMPETKTGGYITTKWQKGNLEVERCVLE